MAPEPENTLEWYFILFGLDGHYKDGFYLGKLIFPQNYPMSPPSIRMTTETGKFIIDHPICMSIGEHHPEGWSPVWTAESFIVGFISLMVTNVYTYGGMYNEPKSEEKLKIAKASKEKMLKNPKVQALFKDM